MKKTRHPPLVTARPGQVSVGKAGRLPIPPSLEKPRELYRDRRRDLRGKSETAVRAA